MIFVAIGKQLNGTRAACTLLLRWPFLLFNTYAGHLAVSSTTWAELLHGAEKSNMPAKSLAVVEDFSGRLEVLPYGIKAAQHYGSIRALLEKRGQTIGVNDLHIAAHARSEGLTLVSNNLREFERVEALQMANWVVRLFP
jgi:tRNA(fMet)-specific endonuclease VapC